MAAPSVLVVSTLAASSVRGSESPMGNSRPSRAGCRRRRGRLACRSPPRPAPSRRASSTTPRPTRCRPNVASPGLPGHARPREFGDRVRRSPARTACSTAVTRDDEQLGALLRLLGRRRATRRARRRGRTRTVIVYSTHLGANGAPDTLLGDRHAERHDSVAAGGGSDLCRRHGLESADGACYNGIAFNAVFDLSSLNVTLPNDVIVGVAYDTQSYGAAPLGVAGPYNSLNVGIPTTQAGTVGSDASRTPLRAPRTAPLDTAARRGRRGPFRQHALDRRPAARVPITARRFSSRPHVLPVPRARTTARKSRRPALASSQRLVLVEDEPQRGAGAARG